MKRARTIVGRVLVVLGVLMLAIVAVGVVRALNRPGDEERIERTIKEVVTTADPADCHTAMTDAYLEQITGLGLPFADNVCEAKTGHADSVAVGGISIDGDRAIATVTYRGGLLEGSTTRVRLIKKGRDWKIDRRLRFIHFDRPGFRRAYRILVGQSGSPGPAVRCSLAREAKLTSAEIERAMLTGDRATLARIAVACDRDGVERSVLGSIAAAELDPAGSSCVERRLAAAGDARLADLEYDIPAFGRFVTSCDPDAFVVYTHRKLVAEGEESPAEIACIVRAFRNIPPSGQLRLTYDEERYEALYGRCEA